jgi:protein-disulfide isomerase
MDFACPYCAAYAPVLRDFIRGYVRDGRAKLELRYLTFVGGDFSRTAAFAALCAGEQGKQWHMHEVLFSMYRGGGTSQFTVDNIIQAARAIPDFDPAAVGTCIQSAKFAGVLDTTGKLAVQLGVGATPTVLVGKDGTGAFQRVEVSEDLSSLLTTVEQIGLAN